TVVETVNGTPSRALVAADVAHLLWAVNLGCLGFHVWPYRADTADADHVDELRLDLDPQPGTGFAEAVEAAVELRALLDEHGITAHPKTTASRGLHVYVRLEPRWTSYQVRAAAVAVARELERRRPDLVTAAWWKEERGRRVFVDYNQTAPHKTVFGAWSVRARVGAQVSTPLTWDELPDVDPDELTIATVPARLCRLGAPWAGMAAHPQPLEPLLEMHERDMAAGLMDAPWPPGYPKQPNEPPRVAPSRARRPDGRAGPRRRRDPGRAAPSVRRRCSSPPTRSPGRSSASWSPTRARPSSPGSPRTWRWTGCSTGATSASAGTTSCGWPASTAPSASASAGWRWPRPCRRSPAPRWPPASPGRASSTWTSPVATSSAAPPSPPPSTGSTPASRTSARSASSSRRWPPPAWPPRSSRSGAAAGAPRHRRDASRGVGADPAG